jgi:FixJ family two-component response regulator
MQTLCTIPPAHTLAAPNRRTIGSGMDEGPVIYIIDDDASLRASIDSLLRSVGHHVRAFASVNDFLAARRSRVPGCLILDVRLPGISGLDFQARLARLEIDLPVILMTGYGDIPMTVRGMKAGAVDFLTKPFRHQDLLDAVATAVERHRTRLTADAEASGLRKRFADLSPREQQVMQLVTAGKMNKQVAGDLGLSEITVKIHRGAAMRKMGARTLADLVRMAEALHLDAH